MPVIVMCSTKGGVGKSTTALVLAQIFSAAGKATTLIDADPNQPLAKWAERAGEDAPKNLSVVAGINEETIVDAIDNAASKDPFVIVDLEGSANLTAASAISRSDLVLIPMAGTQLDADQIGKIIGLIDRQSKLFGRSFKYRIVVSKTKRLVTRELKHIVASLEKNGKPILPATLEERAAYSLIFQMGCTLYDLTEKDVSKPGAAIENASTFAKAVIDVLTERKSEAA